MTATIEFDDLENNHQTDNGDDHPLCQQSLEKEDEKQSVERILRKTSSSDDDETKRKWNHYDEETELWIRQLPKVGSSKTFYFNFNLLYLFDYVDFEI